MVEEIIDLLGKKTITQSDDNGTTGYTVFTATSLYDEYCTSASKTNYFDFSCDNNKIGIHCDDINNLIPSDYWNGTLKPFLEENASIVKLRDSDYSETVAYACKVIFPSSFGIEDPDAIMDFTVYFTAITEDRQNEINMSVAYHISQCSQYHEILLYGDDGYIEDVIGLAENSINKNSSENRVNRLNIEEVVARTTTRDKTNPPRSRGKKTELDRFANPSLYPIVDDYRYVDRNKTIVPNITGQTSATLITGVGFHGATPQQINYTTKTLGDHIAFRFPKTGVTPICIGYKTFNFDAHRHYDDDFNATDNPSIYSGDSTTKMDSFSSDDPILTYDTKIYEGDEYDSNSMQYTYRSFAAGYIKKIKIPSVIKVIGNKAFKNNVNLRKVILANNSELKVIGSYAFENCNIEYFGEKCALIPGYGLSSSAVILPKNIELLGEGAFKNNTDFSDVFIPENLEHIGPAAFCGCESISAIYFHPESKLRKIGAFSFSGCSSGAYEEWTKFPEYLESIGNSAFRGAMFLENIEFKKSIRVIDRTAFYGASNLFSVIFPDNCNLEKIGEWAFRKCLNLKTIKLPKKSNLTAISQGIFNGCTNFCGTYERYEGMHFYELIKETHTINDRRHWYFTPINVMYIPSSVTYIDDFAFEGTDIRGVVFAGSCSFGGSKEFYVENNISYLEFLGESIITDFPGRINLEDTLYITMTIYLWNEINRKDFNDNYVYRDTWEFYLLFTSGGTRYINII